MNSLLVPEPTHPGRCGKFHARRSCAIKSTQSRAVIHRSAGAPVAAPDDLRYELEIAGNGAAGYGQPGLNRNDAQPGLVRITAASYGTQGTMPRDRCDVGHAKYAGDDHVRLDEGLKLLM